MDRLRAAGPAALPAAVAYAVLGALLVTSRVVGLGRSYASDELGTVRNFVRAGPAEILTGPYIPNNHELFSLVGWATMSVVGESAVALRLWSVVPFLLGVALVTAWLHVRVGRFSGVLFLFFATASPLLLDITRQARGYGLAFAAMSVLVVAGLEAERSKRTGWIVAFCAAGVVGAWTLPHFAVAFFATGAILLTSRPTRRSTAVGLTASALAIVAWYMPHLADVTKGTQQEYAAPIEGWWVITAPIDQTLVPALRSIDETLLDPGIASLAVVIGLVSLVSSSPQLRSRHTGLTLGVGVAATIVAFWVTRTHVAPRFFSFLLVPLLMLLAGGIASVLVRFLASGRPVTRAVLGVTALAFAAVSSVHHLERISRLPRESTREAAELIRAIAPPHTRVVAYVPYPRDLEVYLGRAVETPRTPEETERVCDTPTEAILVTQPWLLEPATVSCTGRTGVRHHRLEQYARGGRIDVWLIPSRSY